LPATAGDRGGVGSFEVKSHPRIGRRGAAGVPFRLPDRRTSVGRLVFPEAPGVQESAASGEIQRVMSPRCTSARSYSAPLLTRYFVLYLGWTLECMLRRWPIGQQGPTRSEESANFLYDSCTHARLRFYFAKTKSRTAPAATSAPSLPQCKSHPRVKS
jgi:hypothetical protein